MTEEKMMSLLLNPEIVTTAMLEEACARRVYLSDEGDCVLGIIGIGMSLATSPGSVVKGMGRETWVVIRNKRRTETEENIDRGFRTKAEALNHFISYILSEDLIPDLSGLSTALRQEMTDVLSRG